MIMMVNRELLIMRLTQKIGTNEMNKITINNKKFNFVMDFKDDTSVRHSFNALTKAIFDFDFEDYYKSGYWNERYIPYALLVDGKVVANVAVNVLEFCVLGESQRYIQIGTVMTDQAYRNQGLSRFLLQAVINEWQDKSDMIYLFANDTVSDFYPKFGFSKKLEYQYRKVMDRKERGKSVRRLKMDEPKNRALLFGLADNTRCFSKLSAMHNTALVMFYATSFKKENFYYIEDLDAAVFVEYKSDTLHLNDIFCPHELSVDAVTSAMARPGIDRVVLGFTPADTAGYTCELYFEEDTTLFILTKDKSIFDDHKLMLPILSHA